MNLVRLLAAAVACLLAVSPGAASPDGAQGALNAPPEEHTPNTVKNGYRIVLHDGPEPSGIDLAQNHPNPCDGSTTLGFTLPSRNEVLLSVFDIAGRQVQILVDAGLEAGDYSVAWDGRDDHGERVAAGIYFYRLQGVGFERTRKMVVLR